MTVQNIQSNYGNATVEYARKSMSSEESYRQLLEKKYSQQEEVIQNGSTEEAIPLGGGAYTTEEWDEMLANFDATMDDLREQMRAEHAKRYEEHLEKLAQAAKELEMANIASGAEENVSTLNRGYQDFSTSKYEVVADAVLGCFEVYNVTGERVGAFFYEDMVIKTDVKTGAKLLISEHGTAAYDAMYFDEELIAGFEKCMGVDALPQEALEGFSLNTHLETGISYLIKDGDEGRGGRLLIRTEAEIEALEELSETYLRDYPNLVSNKEVAQINAVLEVLGLMQRTQNGIVSINRDGMSYNDNTDEQKNWALLFEGDYYETVFEFTKIHRVLGTDFSDYKLWEAFFEENEIAIERIWSDQELERDI